MIGFVQQLTIGTGTLNLDPRRIKAEVSETRYKRAWFGAKAKITIGPGLLHKSGFGGLLIPHPRAVNWLLRQGLPDHASRNLIFAHEFAHIQTAPMLFVYLIAVFVLAYIKGRTGVEAVLFLLVSIQAAWEMMSEGLVMFEDFAAYQASYKGIIRLPRVLFWGSMGILAAAGWMLVFHS